MLRLRRLVLTDFRGYASFTWRPTERIAVLHGPNGSGKTNLLEAVSLLVPGRGLRGARAAELPRQGGPGTWAVAGRFGTPQGETDIGTGSMPERPSDRRVFRLDGQSPRSQAEIAARVAIVWLTPQMDRLFQEGLSGRRRFLDRMVWSMEPSHAREIAAHDAALQGRNRLLAEGRGDRSWLTGLEDAIARHGVAATASRLDMAARLNASLTGGVAGAFPAARISLACPIAARLAASPALAVEEWLRAELEANRARDGRTGTTAIGAHRCDMILTDAASGIPATLASTGQRKALLVGLTLAHTQRIAEMRGFAPLLLLDEPAVHLDAERRSGLFKALLDLPAQVLMTGTDAETFLPLRGLAEMLRLGAGAERVDHPAAAGSGK
jgi:DNA replication and repair protein RecF